MARPEKPNYDIFNIPEIKNINEARTILDSALFSFNTNKIILQDEDEDGNTQLNDEEISYIKNIVNKLINMSNKFNIEQLIICSIIIKLIPNGEYSIGIWNQLYPEFAIELL